MTALPKKENRTVSSSLRCIPLDHVLGYTVLVYFKEKRNMMRRDSSTTSLASLFLCLIFLAFSAQGAAEGGKVPAREGSSAKTLLPSVPFEVKAAQACLMDYATGTILFGKEAGSPLIPSSMTKIVTIYEIFTALKDGRLQLSDRLPVSNKAWRMGGSRSFLRVGDRVCVEDLIRGIIVHSGNDACVVVAEALGGTEESFAASMTETAQRLGAKGTCFRNATGWPDKGHYSTAEDLVLLSRRLIQDFPQFYRYFREKEFEHNGIVQRNRNTLLWKDIGVDGIKTGRTDAGGYGVIFSAVQRGRRIVGVVNGCCSDRERAEEAEKLLSWGFREFIFYTLADKGEPVAEAEVWLGRAPTVGLVADKDIHCLVPRQHTKTLKVEVVYQGPLETPIQAGDRVAVLRISIPGQEVVEHPLFAAMDVGQVSAWGRLQAAITYLLFGAKTS